MDYDKEIKRLQEEQRAQRQADLKAAAGRILAWLISIVGQQPEDVTVASIERLLLEAPCDIYISARNKNQWNKKELRDNEISVLIMVPDWWGGGSQGSPANGKTVAEALRMAVDKLRNTAAGI